MNRSEALRLDWSRWQTLDANWDKIDRDRRERLDLIWRKPNVNRRLRNAFGRERHRYVPHGSIIAMSSWKNARAFCECGFRFGNRISRCNHRQLCCWCSHLRKWDALCRFALHFQERKWCFLTISFEGTISADDLVYSPPNAYWDLARQVLAKLIQAKKIRGCLWREELHAASFLPLEMRPHLHSICDAEEMETAEIEAFTRENLRRELGRLLLPLNVDARVIPTANGLCNRLGYINKELNLTRRYREARDRIAPAGDFSLLNEQVEWLLNYFSTSHPGRVQVGCAGTMHALSSDYAGTRSAVFKKPVRESSKHREAREAHKRRLVKLLNSFSDEEFDDLAEAFV